MRRFGSGLAIALEDVHYMKPSAVWFSVLAIAGLAFLLTGTVRGALKPEQRKELGEIKKDLTKVQSLIVKKEMDDAEKLLTDVEQKLRKVTEEAGLKDADAAVAGYFKQIELKKAVLLKRKGGGAGPVPGGVSFNKEVAPILTARCLGCHGDNNPKAGLRMDTFAGMKQGGQDGPLLIAGNAAASLIVQKIAAPGQGRMPPRGDPLKPEEIAKIEQWVNQGARFDGKDESAKIGTGGPGEVALDKQGPPVSVAKATGKESVSFSKQVAPFMVNLCVNCHSGANPRGGLALDTFEKLMRGGKSGRVVLPGNLKDSRLWQLAGEQDPIKMPPGQALITRTNWNNLKTWIEEGAKYDGGDPRATLRSLVPTEAELKAKEIAALSSEEMSQRRKARTEELWKAALPKDTPSLVETPEFLVYGNVSDARLKQIADWADDDAKTLHKVFGLPGGQIWKGRLAIFVFKDRFAYTEFTQTNENLEVPAETTGHSKVTASLDEAYLALQDIGDAPAEDSPGFRVSLYVNLTAGLLQRSAKKVPDWVVRGTGLALAAHSNGKNPYFSGLRSSAYDVVATLEKPADIFADGTFSSATIAPVGFTLVSYMLSVGGEQPFVKFLQQLQGGADLPSALKGVYNADPTTLANLYISGLSPKKTIKKARGKK